MKMSKTYLYFAQASIKVLTAFDFHNLSEARRTSDANIFAWATRGARSFINWLMLLEGNVS